MQKGLKITFLIATLAIPVIIFVFLKLYGENKFSIPVYYEDGVQVLFTECDFDDSPYTVAVGRSNDRRANVTVFFEQKAAFGTTDLRNITTRLRSLFPNDLTFNAFGSSGVDTAGLTPLDSAGFKKMMHCDFVTDTVNQFILHDHKGRIRGYYETDLDEVDRLIVEIKILLENE